jgi:hypothetical protein
MTIRWKIAAAGLTFAVTCAGLLGTDLLGPLPAHARQEKDVKPAIDESRMPNNGRGATPIYYGTAACSNRGCHGGERPTKWVKGLDLITSGDEANVYSMHDKHADAFKVLKGKRGKQMTKLLGYEVSKEKACLACHATVIEDKSLLKASEDLHFNVDEGVSCVTCHGAYEEWVGAHATMVGARHFRKLTPEQKEKYYGLANLRDPVRQAELCVSCHVGNMEQGKFVTHEMYAAGHPPLPSFELGTFADQEPRHWQYLREKTPALQKELGLRKGEQEQTQLVIVGALTAFRDSMRLLVPQAQEAQKTKDPDKKSLDLSNFDCWSCHHGIRSPSWRQERGYEGTPGRPTWRSWPAELVPAALDHLSVVDTKLDVAAARTQFDDKLKALKKAFDAKVYGKPADVEKAAKELAAWADGMIVRSRSAYATSDSTKAVLAKMSPRYGTRGNDYDSAREVAWAFGTIYNEVYGVKGGDPKVRQTLAKLDKELKLKLSQGRGNWVEDELDLSLDAIKKYDPKTFRPLMLSLGSAFGKR